MKRFNYIPKKSNSKKLKFVISQSFYDFILYKYRHYKYNFNLKN